MRWCSPSQALGSKRAEARLSQVDDDPAQVAKGSDCEVESQCGREGTRGKTSATSDATSSDSCELQTTHILPSLEERRTQGGR